MLSAAGQLRLNDSAFVYSSESSVAARGELKQLLRLVDVVARLAGLFGLDALAGGLVVQSFLAYFFASRFGADLLAAHVKDHQSLYARVSLRLGPDSEQSRLPTDERIRRYGNGQDESLAALFFQFGRYLLIASSRPGGQPPNLQGLWNDRVLPPWNSGYTVNINTEMNYWPAEPTDLAECVEPLVSMLAEHLKTKLPGAQAFSLPESAELSDMIRRQQELMDETHRTQRDQQPQTPAKARESHASASTSARMPASSGGS